MSLDPKSVLMSGCLAAISVTGVWVLPAAAEGMAPSPTWHLTVQGGRMTARVQDVPLEMVLRELSRRGALTVSIQGTVARDPVSVRFRNLPLEEGIQKVLEGKEYAIIHNSMPSPDARPSALSSVREIIVFSGPDYGGSGSDQWMKVGGAAEGPKAPAPRVLGEGPQPVNPLLQLEEMGDMADEDELLQALARALEDQDPRLRAKAMDVLEDTVGPIPIPQLAQIAQTERDALMRSRALTLLAFRGEESAVQPLTHALQDPDAAVRNLAADLLSQLGLTSPAEPAPLAELP